MAGRKGKARLSLGERSRAAFVGIKPAGWQSEPNSAMWYGSIEPAQRRSVLSQSGLPHRFPCGGAGGDGEDVSALTNFRAGDFRKPALAPQYGRQLNIRGRGSRAGLELQYPTSMGVERLKLHVNPSEARG